METNYGWILFALFMIVALIYFVLAHSHSKELKSLAEVLKGHGLGPSYTWIKRGKILWPWWNRKLPWITMAVALLGQVSFNFGNLSDYLRLVSELIFLLLIFASKSLVNRAAEVVLSEVLPRDRHNVIHFKTIWARYLDGEIKDHSS